jgi:drug/metabolite transporter (DMT)-like permease
LETNSEEEGANMKKVAALMLGLALLAVIVTPQAEAAHGRGTAFFVGALTGALVAGAVASSYAYPAYYYSYPPQPVAVQQPVYRVTPLTPITARGGAGTTVN